MQTHFESKEKPKLVAWGTSKLLWLYKTQLNELQFSYVIDSNPKQKMFLDLPVHPPSVLEAEHDCNIVIFAVSSSTINLILAKLAKMGRGLGNGVILYSDLFRADFKKELKKYTGWEADDKFLSYAESFTLNSIRPVHTTICGSWLILEALKHTEDVVGDVVEVGAYQGGNALCALLSPAWTKNRKYYIFDSFQGFPDLSKNDPINKTRGSYSIDISVQEVRNSFHALKDAVIIEGFIPETFTQLPAKSSFAVVFFDCDLYQPALDTFEYFWDKLTPGGIFLVHDYFAEPGGYEGVKMATDEFFQDKNLKISKFPHCTMALIQKEK